MFPEDRQAIEKVLLGRSDWTGLVYCCFLIDQVADKSPAEQFILHGTGTDSQAIINFFNNLPDQIQWGATGDKPRAATRQTKVTFRK